MIRLEFRFERHGKIRERLAEPLLLQLGDQIRVGRSLLLFGAQPGVSRIAKGNVSLAGEHSVIVVEHDMDFVRSIARTVTVLHEGRVLAEGDMDCVQNDPRVIDVYLGA